MNELHPTFSLLAEYFSEPVNSIQLSMTETNHQLAAANGGCGTS
jgi:hypothetical protein